MFLVNKTTIAAKLEAVPYTAETLVDADFNIRKSKEELQPLILNNEDLNLVKKEGTGWILTDEGGRVCDAFLNKNLKEFEL